ncbi:clavesin-1-like [Schistocerca cancellata]|uniref:clavesin-1-like n=1 Tax=Schistocerca cancellata TaxID=274614 RepID=UPI0021181865|nr:clavesin-1-like [Schistocerca cancellata]
MFDHPFYFTESLHDSYTCSFQPATPGEVAFASKRLGVTVEDIQIAEMQGLVSILRAVAAAAATPEPAPRDLEQRRVFHRRGTSADTSHAVVAAASSYRVRAEPPVTSARRSVHGGSHHHRDGGRHEAQRGTAEPLCAESLQCTSGGPGASKCETAAQHAKCAMTDSGKYFAITAEEVAYVRKQLGTNEEDIKTAVTSLREWLRLQPHLPDAVDDSLIERMYINCKCSMERVKLGLDAYFSLKNRIPEFLMNRDARGTDIQFAMEHIKMMTMPRLTKDAYRVHVITAVDEDSMNIIWAPYGKILSIAMEVMFVEDYSIGDVCIIDMANVNAGHVVRADINIIRNLELCYKTAYCRRLKGLHFVNASKIMDSAMKIVKMALSEKLQKRVFVHLPGSTSLFDHVQRDCLPDELGGTAGPVDKLAYPGRGMRDGAQWRSRKTRAAPGVVDGALLCGPLASGDGHQTTERTAAQHRNGGNHGSRP